MPGMTPDAAFEDFAKPIRAAVACLDTAAHLNTRRVGDLVIISSPVASGIAMTRGSDRLQLDTSFNVQPISMDDGSSRWRVTTLQYIHELSDQHGKRVAAWHWHPENQRSHATFPHLHVAAESPWNKLHYPTGRVLIEDIVRFAIRELDVTPTRHEWEEGLDVSGKLQREHSSW